MWYLLQLGIVLYIVYICKEEVTPDIPLGHIALLGFLLAWGITWMLSQFIDLTTSLKRRVILWLNRKNAGSLSGAESGPRPGKPFLISNDTLNPRRRNR